MNDKLKAYRENIGKTTQEMADIIGISDSLYVKIERGERNPSYGFLKKFTVAFPHLDIEKLFFKQ
jgi:putative transcriptional regulator